MELPKDANLQELLKALGMNTRQNGDHEWLGRLSLFGAGVLVGAGVALLLTPPAGEQEEPAAEDESRPA